MPISFTPAASSGRHGLRAFRGFAPGKAAAFLLCAFLACALRSASASSYQINVAATNLTVGSRYNLSFELQNALLNNPLQAQISNFSLLGGTLGGSSYSSFGNSPSGDLSSILGLATTAQFDLSDYLQEFTSTADSAVMAFTLNLSSSAPQNDPAMPDFFRFSFVDSSGMTVTTEADDGTSLVHATFDSTSPSVQTYRSSNFTDMNPTGPKVAAQIQPSAAPEPGTLALLLPSVGGAAALLCYRRKLSVARS